ncbi:MAG TPA: hypothetical protein VGU64_14900 [Terriglobales bacterium]|nr:hypothetical protein [Terriglobales bacterium]
MLFHFHLARIGRERSGSLALAATSPITGTINTHTHFTDNIVRVGLNYQFH